MIIDSHQHIWDPTVANYSWLDENLFPINRAIHFPEFRSKMKNNKINFTVLVQSADNLEDTQLMLDAASQYPEIIGIVAYLPLEDPILTGKLASDYSTNPKIVGVRNLIHTYPNPVWLLHPNVRKSLDILSEYDLTFDLVSTKPEHLELLPILSNRHPELKLVIDHLSKPPISEGVNSPEASNWRYLMSEAAKNPNVFAKISGLYPSNTPMNWNSERIRPFILEALDYFGSERLMYGGDWPISILSGDYERVFEGLEDIISEFSELDQQNIWSDTAKNFYALSLVGGVDHELQ